MEEIIRQLRISQEQIGALSVAIGKLAAGLHGAGLIDGNAYAANLRISQSPDSEFEHAQVMLETIADGVQRDIAYLEDHGYAGLKPVPE